MISQISPRESTAACLALLLLIGATAPAGGQEQPAPAAEQAQVNPAGAAADTGTGEVRREIRGRASGGQAAMAPRFEFVATSSHQLLTQLRRSRSSVFARHIMDLVRELHSQSTDGVDAEQIEAVWGALRDWPDISVEAGTFAPDREGRARWAIRLGLPLDTLSTLLKQLLQLEAAETVFEGVALHSGKDGYSLRLNDRTLAFLTAADESRVCCASHKDLTLPAKLWSGPETQDPALVAARLNLARTEKDSGATFLSKFRAVTAVDYCVGLDEQGDWVDTLRVHWPPVAGMALKAFLGRVRQTFFVPDEAFGAAVFSTGVAPGLIEEAAGLGASATSDGKQGSSESAKGPIGRRADSQVCLTLLPGTGFLPAPDLVAQFRVARGEEFIQHMRRRIRAINEKYQAREEPAPWEEVEVQEHAVFWSNAAGGTAAMSLPLLMRPVIFVHQEVDAQQRQRDFLVVGWTSTNPERFARRWLDLPRGADRRYLPNQEKTNGQLWINWRQLYAWIHPYVNLSVRVVSTDTALPPIDEVGQSMSHGNVTARMNYQGLRVTHQGPVPMGILAVPLMASASLAEDRSGRTDLARERLASRQLRVLHHHCQLFRKDIGRWPTRVAELDGYVDFAGHPQLLRLQLSSKKKWNERFQRLFKSKKKGEQEEEEDQETGPIDDSLYVVHWEDQSWTLGIAKGKLEHLDRLYINQDGMIHRIEKQASNGKAQPVPSAGGSAQAATEADPK